MNKIHLTPVVKNLLIINAALFLIGEVFPNYREILFNTFALHNPFSENFMIFQLVTHAFLHGSLFHIASNMFALVSFGPILETFAGGKKFLIYYLICALGGGLLCSGIDGYESYKLQSEAKTYIANPNAMNLAHFMKEHTKEVYAENLEYLEFFEKNEHNQETVKSSIDFVKSTIENSKLGLMIGASGAIFGLLVAFGYIFPKQKLQFLLFPPIEAQYSVIIYGAIELFLGVYKIPGDPISHYGHLGGLLFGLIMLLLFQKRGLRNY